MGRKKGGMGEGGGRWATAAERRDNGRRNDEATERQSCEATARRTERGQGNDPTGRGHGIWPKMGSTRYDPTRRGHGFWPKTGSRK